MASCRRSERHKLEGQMSVRADSMWMELLRGIMLTFDTSNCWVSFSPHCV